MAIQRENTAAGANSVSVVTGFFCFLLFFVCVYLSSFYVNFYYGTSFVYTVCVCIHVVFTCSLVFALVSLTFFFFAHLLV